MRYRLRTLLIVLAVGPVVLLALMWCLGAFLEAVMGDYSLHDYLMPWDQ